MLGELDPGGLAEYVTCPASQAIAIPDHVSFDARRACPWPGAPRGAWWSRTRAEARRRRARARRRAAASGSPRCRSPSSWARASSPRRRRTTSSRASASTAPITWSTTRRTSAGTRTVRALTGKRGVDVIIETVGEATWEQSIRALGKGGRLVTSGATSGPIGPTDIRYLFRREQQLMGSNGWTHDELRRVAVSRSRARCARSWTACCRSPRPRRASSRSSGDRSSARSSSTPASDRHAP